MQDAEGFPRLNGQKYRDFLARLHADVDLDWYLEVGSRNGRSLAPARCNTVAVDPVFRITSDVIGAKPRLLVFQETSDAFFASGFLERNDIRLSFAFLDGLHLFEFLLRDFIGAEANSRPEGVIAMHDCVPFRSGMTGRDLENLPGGAWTGDVWKLIPILQHYRPELKVTVLGCRPTGLVLVSGLDPGNTVLKRQYDRILADWIAADLPSHGVERFFASFDLTDPQDYAAAGYPAFRGLPGVSRR
jgi:hypothetical protein